MDLLLLIGLSLFIAVLAFGIVGKHCHHVTPHKIYDPPADPKRTGSPPDVVTK